MCYTAYLHRQILSIDGVKEAVPVSFYKRKYSDYIAKRQGTVIRNVRAPPYEKQHPRISSLFFKYHGRHNSSVKQVITPE